MSVKIERIANDYNARKANRFGVSVSELAELEQIFCEIKWALETVSDIDLVCGGEENGEFNGTILGKPFSLDITACWN